MDKLTYQTSPEVTFASNTFINVPIIFQFDETPLISIVHEQNLGFTTEIQIYHPDGTYLAKVKGMRIFPTAAGKKADLEIVDKGQIIACKIGKRIAFEIERGSGYAFKTTQAELYTPNGFFVKTSDAKPELELCDKNANSLQVGGITMIDCVFQNLSIGVLLKSDGSCKIGVS